MIAAFLALAGPLLTRAAQLTAPARAVLAWVGLVTALVGVLLLVRALRRARRRKRPRIVVDGSNVMYWRDNTPGLAPLREVIAQLSARGFEPGVIFDANAGYRLVGSYLNERALAKLLGLPLDCVLVMNKGVPADRDLLRAARAFQVRIVTNDRYREWAEAFPEIANSGQLIRGGYREGELWLDLD